MPPLVHSNLAPLLGSVSAPTGAARPINYGELARDTRVSVLDLLDFMEQTGIKGDPALDALLARYESVKEDVKRLLAQRQAGWVTPALDFILRASPPATNGEVVQAGLPVTDPDAAPAPIVELSPSLAVEGTTAPEIIKRVSPVASPEQDLPGIDNTPHTFGTIPLVSPKGDFAPPATAHPAPTLSVLHAPLASAVHTTNIPVIAASYIEATLNDIDAHAARRAGLPYPHIRIPYRAAPPPGGQATSSTANMPAFASAGGLQIPTRGALSAPNGSAAVIPTAQNGVSSRNESNPRADPSNPNLRTPLSHITTYTSSAESTSRSRFQLPVSWVRSVERPPSEDVSVPVPPRNTPSMLAPPTPPTSAERPTNGEAGLHGPGWRVGPPPRDANSDPTAPTSQAALTLLSTAQPAATAIRSVERPPTQVSSEPLDPSALPSVSNGMAYGFVPKIGGGWEMLQLPVTRTSHPAGINSPPAQVEVLGQVYSLQALPPMVTPTSSGRAPSKSGKRIRDGRAEQAALLSQTNVSLNNFTLPTFYPASYNQAFRAGLGEAAIPAVPSLNNNVERPAKRVRRSDKPPTRRPDLIDLTGVSPTTPAAQTAPPPAPLPIASLAAAKGPPAEAIDRRAGLFACLLAITKDLNRILSSTEQQQAEAFVKDKYAERFHNLDQAKAQLSAVEVNSTGLRAGLTRFSQQTGLAFHGNDKLADKARSIVEYWDRAFGPLQ